MSIKAKVPIPAAHVSGLSLGTPGQNTLTAVAGGGVRGTDGRPVRLVMTDAEVRGIIARLAVDPRWSAAIETAARIGFPLGPQVTAEEQGRYRRHLCERMADAMAEADRVRS
jgi:hypothetical protein